MQRQQLEDSFAQPTFGNTPTSTMPKVDNSMIMPQVLPMPDAYPDFKVQ